MRRRRGFRSPRSLRATRAGWCFLTIILGVGFAALNTGNNLLYLVLALMLAFLVLSGLLSETALRGIRVSRVLPRELFAHTPGRIVLRVQNTQKRMTTFALIVEDHVETTEGANVSGRVFALRIRPGESTDRSYMMEPARRGELRFDRVRISTRFPFGLFVKSAEHDVEMQAVVYPQIFAVPPPEDETTSKRSADSRRGSTPTGDDVAGLREFVPGDALGRVHWKRSLRSGRLLVIEREGEAAGEIEVLLRADPNAASTTIEENIALAASQISNHLEAGLRVGLRTASCRFAPSVGSSHRRELLTYLAHVSPESLAPSGRDEAKSPQRPTATREIA